MIRAALAIGAVAFAGGCGDVDEPWQLDHDRIIAVRATPPGIVAGAHAELDALIGRKGAPPTEAVPTSATVVSPPSLAGALQLDDGRWRLTAPSDDRLATARLELDLAADAPLPVVIHVTFAASTFPSGTVPRELAATKIVWLGEAAENPVLDAPEVDGVAAPSQEILVGHEIDVRLSVASTEPDNVNWLTSCGVMHDYDLAQAYLRVEPEDPEVGDLAVVVRTAIGGVAWRVWSIRAE